MSNFSCLRNRPSLRCPQARAQHRPAAPRFRPQLEALEDRWLPSTLTVLNLNDSGPGSLRAEIAAAKSNNTIIFAPSLDGQTITLTSGQLVINKNLTIQGPGAGHLAISGNYQPFAGAPTGCRVFEIDSVTATIAGLTIRDGYADLNTAPTVGGDGGAILNWGGNLNVKNCVLTNNYATSGGAIYNDGDLTVSACTVSGNHFTMSGGGIFNAYACHASVTDSTISGNSGPQFAGYTTGPGSSGGGIYNSGVMTLSGTTVTSNSADWGAGVYEDAYAVLSILHKSDLSGNIGEDLFLAFGASSATISRDSYIGVIEGY